MTPLPPAHFTRARTYCTWLLRAAAVACLALGAFLLIKRLSFGAVNGLRDALTSWEGIGEDHSFYRGLALTLVGAALAAFSRTLSAWIIALPLPGCPRCGYAGVPPTATTCPECGLTGFVEDTARTMQPERQ